MQRPNDHVPSFEYVDVQLHNYKTKWLTSSSKDGLKNCQEILQWTAKSHDISKHKFIFS